MNIESSFSKAQRLENRGKVAEAAQIYCDVLDRFPKNKKAKNALALLKKLRVDGSEPPAKLQAKLVREFESGAWADTANAVAELLQSYQSSQFLWNLLGNCHMKLGDLTKAHSCLVKAAELGSDTVHVLTSLGRVESQLDRYDEAIATFLKLLDLEPNNGIHLKDLGVALWRSGRMSEALDCLQTACRLSPTNPEVIFKCASLTKTMGDMETARKLLQVAIELQPDHADAQLLLGNTLASTNNLPEAVKAFSSAVSGGPTKAQAQALKLHTLGKMCDWSWVEEYGHCADSLGLSGDGVPPFAFLALEDDHLRLKKRTEIYTKAHFPQPINSVPAAPRKNQQKHRIGYFSADFYAHATMHLIGGLFEQHDRDRFEIFAYSYGPDKQDEFRTKVQTNVDCFRDIRTLTDAAAIGVAQADQLDIAVDLKGYTAQTRSPLFASRLALVHMSYLGYPGTMGHAAFDYLVADKVVCPPQYRDGYTENLIRLPDSYQINDNKREISDCTFSRQELGLPEDGFVFCSFNNNYKITPREFDIWMRLLQQVEGSVLWLLRSNSWSEANLKREAEARGVDASRLVFAGRMPLAKHLARQRHADLFLDTFNVNAHTTASDALWAGLPVLTMAGKQFAARVAASLLHATGLPELVTDSYEEYEALALELAQNPERLTAMSSHLEGNRMSLPLFDTPRFTRHLESAYDQVMARHEKGLAPGDLDIEAIEMPLVSEV